VGFADRDFPPNKHPGMTKKSKRSFGYKSDGKVFSNKIQSTITMPKMDKDHVIGCGINFLKREIFFTHNGVCPGPAFKDIEIFEYFPTIGLHSQHESIQFNFGNKPFKFDIAEYTNKEIIDGIRCILDQNAKI